VESLGGKERLKFYLAGPIDFTTGSQDKTWRRRIGRFLKKRGHEVRNPLHKPLPKAIGDPRNYLQELRDQGKIGEVRGFVRRFIIPPDLAMVDECEIVLAYLPRGFRICGTWGEITYAFAHGKAVFIVSNIPTSLLPNWVIGCSTFIFPSFKEFKRFFGSNKNEGAS